MRNVPRTVSLSAVALILVLSAPMMPSPPRMQLRAAREVATGMDRDLLEITIPRLEELYSKRRYSVTQVTQWFLERIDRYNNGYKAVQYIDRYGALATAAAEDESARKGGATFRRGALWGVPIVVKANTSVKGLVTNDGWMGYLVPGHELIAPMDATIVAKLRAAGAVILGQTNMPDFAASDTNISSAFGRTGNGYDWRFSPGGSSGGTVTAITANFAVFGTGTDTSNSIRMPSATSAVVGVLPTRGLVSTTGIHPLDWLLDGTGPIARDVIDAAIALDVMVGEDAKDFRTMGSISKAQPGPYVHYLKVDALKGKRFGVPAFIVGGTEENKIATREGPPLWPETRQMFMQAIDSMRTVGATVVFDDSILPESFLDLTYAIETWHYRREGVDNFFRDFGPAQYHSPAEYEAVVGFPLPLTILGVPGEANRIIENDPAAEATVWGPQRRALAAYDETLNRFHLDGFVYPALQMPPNDETIPQPDGRRSTGPHSRTAWVNRIGVPAVVLPAGFYENSLPFGIELSGRSFKDGDLLGWAFAFEHQTKFRKPPILKVP